MAVLFYRTSAPYGCFGNFAPWKVFIDGKVWPTTEHYFQAAKFFPTDPMYAEHIREARGAGTAARLGRDRSRPLRRDWESVKDDYMRIAVGTKFRDHGEPRGILLGTKDEQIIEDTRDSGDAYWGWGRNKKGKNMLGVILMEVRDALRKGTIEQYIADATARVST